MTYPADWDSRARKVYKRDDYTCQNCGQKGGPHSDIELQAHHVVPLSKGGSNELGNIKTLCSRCHDAIHYDVMAPTAGPPTAEPSTSGLSGTQDGQLKYPEAWEKAQEGGFFSTSESTYSTSSEKNVYTTPYDKFVARAVVIIYLIMMWWVLDFAGFGFGAASVLWLLAFLLIFRLTLVIY